jgi:hypothetical protein
MAQPCCCDRSSVLYNLSQPALAVLPFDRCRISQFALCLPAEAASMHRLPTCIVPALLLLLLLLQVDLPVDKGVVLLDIGFTGSDPNHGEEADSKKTFRRMHAKQPSSSGMLYTHQAKRVSLHVSLRWL